MLNKKTLKAILAFTENQQPAPSFIIIYLVTWLVWHNQIVSTFISATGDIWSRMNSAIAAVNENQYLVVFFLTCFIFILRLAYHYARFKSTELLNSSDDDYLKGREDQTFERNEDIAQLMSTLELVQQQLAESKAREKKAISERNEQVKKVLTIQYELEEARADVKILTENVNCASMS